VHRENPNPSLINASHLEILERDNAMRKTMIIYMSAALLTGTALTSSAIARDRSDRTELSASQMADRADARTAKMKVDLNLTADQEKNWSGFASAMQDISKKQADHRIAMHDARAQQQGKFDALDEMRKSADAQIERANDRKKLADAAQPLYTSLNEQQKQRFAEMVGSDRERETY
jgi:LTXXQ motif family protein